MNIETILNYIPLTLILLYFIVIAPNAWALKKKGISDAEKKRLNQRFVLISGIFLVVGVATSLLIYQHQLTRVNQFREEAARTIEKK